MSHPSDPTAPHAGATSKVPAYQAPPAPQRSMRVAAASATTAAEPRPDPATEARR